MAVIAKNNILTLKNPPCSADSFSLPHSEVATASFLATTIVLSFPECHAGGITQYVVFVTGLCVTPLHDSQIYPHGSMCQYFILFSNSI